MPSVSASAARRCSRTACDDAASATLTYVYAASEAVVGPLAPAHEPHTYDLCPVHADRLTAPRGWAVLRMAAAQNQPDPSTDDLEALADAVREAARSTLDASADAFRRGHLRVLPTPT